MAYAPYLFGALSFRAIYDEIRWLGVAFLVGGCAVFLAGPRCRTSRGSRALELLGALVLAGALCFFAAHLIALGRGLQGPVFYGGVALFLLVEQHPPLRRRGLLYEGLFTVAGAVGLLLLVDLVSITLRSPLGLALPLTGAVLLLSACVGHLARRAGRQVVARVSLFATGSGFLLLAWGFTPNEVWTAVCTYVLAGLGCMVLGGRSARRPRSSLRAHLFRGAAAVACVPLLALGVVASAFVQRGIESDLRGRLEDLAFSRAALVHARLAHVRDDLEVLAEDARFSGAAEPNDIGRALGQPPGGAPIRLAAEDPLVERLARDRLTSTLGTLILDDDRLLIAALVDEARGGGAVVVVQATAEVLADEEATRSSTLSTRLDDGVASLALVKARARASGVVSAMRFGPGGPTLLARARLPESSLYIVAEEPLAAALSPVTKLGLATIGLLLLACALGLLLARSLSRTLSVGLSRVRDVTREIADGRLDARVETQDVDELDELAGAVNRMAARTKAAQDALGTTNEELRAALRLRDDFLSMAGHELRTPLAALSLAAIGARRRLERGVPEDAPMRDARVVAMINRQVQRLTVLVNDLLDVARMRGGRLKIEPIPLDLRSVVDDALEAFRQDPEHAARLCFPRRRAPVTVTADPTRIEQVVVNLVQNALKHSGADGVVTVDVAHEGATALLSVHDEGAGIPEDSMDQVFEPFVRLSPSADGSLGLGLHICRDIAERHGGAIWAERGRGGRGTSFHVRLPAPALDVETTPRDDVMAAE